MQNFKGCHSEFMLLGGLNVYGSTCLFNWQIFMSLANQGPHFFCHSDDHQILKWDFQSGEATQVRLPGTLFRDCHTRDFPLSISRLSSFLRRRMPQTSTGFLLVSAQRRHQTSLTCLYWHALTVSLQSWGFRDLYERSRDLYEGSCDLYERSCDLYKVMWLVWEVMCC